MCLKLSDHMEIHEDAHSWISPQNTLRHYLQECERHLTFAEHCLTSACILRKLSLVSG